MELYWKTLGALLTAVILGVHFGKQERDFSVLLTMTVCCMGAAAAVTFLEPVLELMKELGNLVPLKNDVLIILFKCTGIALVSELAGLICRDAGSSSLEKSVHLLGTAVILSLSVPVMTALLTLLKEILGEL